jgi:2-C-methyl-D-erythritol 4-phosphate cytidylyltransferase
MDHSSDFWVVVPAAGSARRMGAELPKQYLTIAGCSVIEHALRPLLARAECRGIVVALAPGDRRFATLPLAHEPRIRTVVGGAERADSVRAGLEALSDAAPKDWVLVHDAARPCLSDEDLAELLRILQHDQVGGLLAAPVVDTLKRADDTGRVHGTVDRASLWHALTPQMFRFEVLSRAVAESRGATDESQAVEALGLMPKLVCGSSENLKITVPADLARAERILMSKRPVTLPRSASAPRNVEEGK